MPTPTLTIPKMEHPTDGHEIPGGTFRFIRGLEGEHNGEGNWISLYHFMGLPPGTIVHIDLQKDLTELAKARGLDEVGNFKRFLSLPKSVKEEKEKEEKAQAKAERAAAPKAKAKGKRVNSAPMVGYNPFKKGKSIPY